MVKNCGQKIASFLKVGRKHLNSNKNDLKWRMNLCFRSFCGRSGEAQTRGLRIPNAARYQLRYTPIVIKLWSCKWSNLWSNTFLTAIFCFPYRPKIARLKGFRRLAPINVRNAVYAPKAGALPPALHLDIFISTFFLYLCFLPCFVRPLAVPVISSAQ